MAHLRLFRTSLLRSPRRLNLVLELQLTTASFLFGSFLLPLPCGIHRLHIYRVDVGLPEVSQRRVLADVGTQNRRVGQLVTFCFPGIFARIHRLPVRR
jgi:hypothetical protein